DDFAILVSSPLPGSQPSPGRGTRRASILRTDVLQYESELTTSLPFLVPSAAHAWKLTELLMNLTDPSQNAVLAPPGCREDAATTLAAPDQGCPRTPVLSVYQHDLRLGVWVWL